MGQLSFQDAFTTWKVSVLSDERVILLSPYISNPVIARVLQKADPTKVDLYTLFSIRNFAIGASSLKALKGLSKRGVHLWHLDDLHAKVLLTENFLSIGSQNFTHRGTTNKEATFTTDSPELIQVARESIDGWAKERKKITLELIESVQVEVGVMIGEYQKLESKCVALESIAFDAELQRENDIVARDEFNQKLQMIKSGIVREMEGVETKLTAEFLIQKSAWWDHPKAYFPVESPGDARLIKSGVHGWEIYRGNTFLITQAYRECLKKFSEFIEVCDKNGMVPLDKKALIKSLYPVLQYNVVDYKGDLFDDGFPICGTELQFGNHWIDVDDFIWCAVSLVGLNRLF